MLATDASRLSPTTFTVQDGATVPVVSPKTGITTAQAFTPPPNALAMIFQASAACRYGNNSYLDGSAANKGYKSGQALSDISVPCFSGQTIYIAAETGTITVDFIFEMLS